MDEIKNIEKQIIKIESDISQAKTELSEATGAKNETLKNLKENFDVNTIEEAEAKNIENNNKLEEVKKSIIEKFSTLQEHYV